MAASSAEEPAPGNAEAQAPSAQVPAIATTDQTPEVTSTSQPSPPHNLQDDDLPDFDAIDREEVVSAQEPAEVNPHPEGELPTAMEQSTTEAPDQPQTVPQSAAAPPVLVQEPAAAVITKAPA
eukprot:4081714-Amphidinium_carterae.1